MVKIVKRLIKKTQRSNDDFYLGLLAIRNAPLSCGKSPAQLLLGFNLSDTLPSVVRHTPNFFRNMDREKKQMKSYHDQKYSGTASIFQPGQIVSIQHQDTREWTIKGKILNEVAPRSYTVRLRNGNIIRRNQIALRRVYGVSLFSPGEGVYSSKPAPCETLPVNANDSEDTIPYNECEEIHSDATIPYDDSEDSNLSVSEDENVGYDSSDDVVQRSRFGRKIKRKRVLDYEEL